jgi:lipopolysaccharide/colanic/teichoic acid biosynthesis glycosyltransferase
MLKFFFDVLASLVGLVLFSPVFLIMSWMIKCGDNGPVFYRGMRIGRFGKPFRIVKFRTMVADAEYIGASSTPENDPRITNIGRFLRKYKLDELPQLINVLKGEMSLVGPRPQVPWAVELYSEEGKKLLSVRPGITDYASIKFRNEAEILKGSADPDKDYLEKIAPEKLRLGLEYINNRSLWLDIQIVFKTIVVLFRKSVTLDR